MTQPQRVTWTGKSGSQYEYTVYLMDSTNWSDVPGNYIFAGLSGNVSKPAYIGETQSFKDRLPGHEKKPCAIRNGASHIHAHVNNGGQAARRAEEADLIDALPDRRWLRTHITC